MSKAVQVAGLLSYLPKGRVPGKSQCPLPCVDSWAVVLVKSSSSPEGFLNGRINVSCAKMTWFCGYIMVNVSVWFEYFFMLYISFACHEFWSWKKYAVTCQSVRPLMSLANGDTWVCRYCVAVQPDTTLKVLVKMGIEEGRGMEISGFWLPAACIFSPLCMVLRM